MHTALPTPARLRILIEGADRLPTITPDLVALTQEISELGITPDKLHPVIALLMRQAALLVGLSRGWTRSFAVELGAEQAEEYRQLGLAHQLRVLCDALGRDPIEMTMCLYAVQCGETKAVLRRLAIPELEAALPHAVRTPRKQASRRSAVS